MFGMKRLALIALMAVGMSSAAMAATVTYSSVGTFSLPGAGAPAHASIVNTATTSTVTITNGATSFIAITFKDMPVNTVTSPTNNPLGTFVVTSNDTSFLTDTTIDFLLTINQTVPSPGGSGSFGTATVSGKIKINSSLSTVTFSAPTSITIPGTLDDVTYTLLSNPTILVAPSAGGTTTIQGAINDRPHGAPVPLPASALGGSALLGLVFLAKKRSQRNSA